MIAVGPSHTFSDLARAINNAFARWDLAHLSQFTLADGQLITDEESGADVASSPFGTPQLALDIDKARVSKVLRPGDECQYVFDLGDDWTHCCTVDSVKIDPVEEFGHKPMTPTSYWGWGSIPDQYGRRWDGDAAGAKVPPRPKTGHPMYSQRWPGTDDADSVDVAALRSAVERRDGQAIVREIVGHDVSGALQETADAILVAHDEIGKPIKPLLASIAARLEMRGDSGDRDLADTLFAFLRM